MKDHEIKKCWFIERIGKRVFRDKNTCSCNTCKEVFEKGLIIEDYDHAIYLFDISNELGLNYYDNKENAN
jgi:hypothetical protein